MTSRPIQKPHEFLKQLTGHDIVVYERVDGSLATITKEQDETVIRINNRKLDQDFHGIMQTVESSKEIAEKFELYPNAVITGYFSNKHSTNYPDSVLNCLFVHDIETNGKHFEVIPNSKDSDVLSPPVLFRGELQDVSSIALPRLNPKANWLIGMLTPTGREFYEVPQKEDEQNVLFKGMDNQFAFAHNEFKAVSEYLTPELVEATVDAAKITDRKKINLLLINAIFEDFSNTGLDENLKPGLLKTIFWAKFALMVEEYLNKVLAK